VFIKLLILLNYSDIITKLRVIIKTRDMQDASTFKITKLLKNNWR